MHINADKIQLPERFGEEKARCIEQRTRLLEIVEGFVDIDVEHGRLFAAVALWLTLQKQKHIHNQRRKAYALRD